MRYLTWLLAIFSPIWLSATSQHVPDPLANTPGGESTGRAVAPPESSEVATDVPPALAESFSESLGAFQAGLAGVEAGKPSVGEDSTGKYAPQSTAGRL